MSYTDASLIVLQLQPVQLYSIDVTSSAPIPSKQYASLIHRSYQYITNAQIIKMYVVYMLKNK